METPAKKRIGSFRRRWERPRAVEEFSSQIAMIVDRHGNGLVINLWWPSLPHPNNEVKNYCELRHAKNKEIVDLPPKTPNVSLEIFQSCSHVDGDFVRWSS